MLIIADSGSTKTEWAMISPGGTYRCVTEGINPVYMSCPEIAGLIKAQLPAVEDVVEAVWFYGAGCLPSNSASVEDMLSEVFSTREVFVGSDLLGAARSLLGHKPGVACILGTGSNSACYDGNEIIENTPSMGFILGDEGSGADVGKRLVSAVFKGLLPAVVSQAFFEEYKLTYPELIEAVYKRPFPNRFLAGFSKFIYTHIEVPEVEAIVKKSFSDFVERNLLRYKSVRSLPVSFTGGVAFNFRNQLQDVIDGYLLNLGEVTGSPMDGLVKYHAE